MSEDYVKEISTRLYLCLALIMVGMLPPVLAYFQVLKPDDELSKVWFQRSGSITVFIAISIEFLMIKIQKFAVLTGDVIPVDSRPEQKYSMLYLFIVYAAGGLAIIGTLIWGYGDLLYV